MSAAVKELRVRYGAEGEDGSRRLQSCTCEAGRRDGNGSGIRVGSSQDGCGAKAEEEKVRCESFDARGWMRGGKVNSLIKLN